MGGDESRIIGEAGDGYLDSKDPKNEQQTGNQKSLVQVSPARSRSACFMNAQTHVAIAAHWLLLALALMLLCNCMQAELQIKQRRSISLRRL